MSDRRPLKYPCPHCGAEMRKPCRSEAGDETYYVHSQRRAMPRLSLLEQTLLWDAGSASRLRIGANVDRRMRFVDEDKP